jgi:hypothetical protein
MSESVHGRIFFLDLGAGRILSANPEIPSKAEAELAKQTKDILSPRLGKNATLNLRAMNFASEPTVKIPAPAARLLVQILDEMSGATPSKSRRFTQNGAFK